MFGGFPDGSETVSAPSNRIDWYYRRCLNSEKKKIYITYHRGDDNAAPQTRTKNARVLLQNSLFL